MHLIQRTKKGEKKETLKAFISASDRIQLDVLVVRLDIPHHRTLGQHSSGMHKVEQGLHNKHGQRIKNIRIPLMALQHTVAVLLKLNDAENATHDDQDSSDKQRLEQASPRHRAGLRYRRRGSCDAPDTKVEGDGDHEKEAEKDELEPQTQEHELFARVGHGGFDHHATTSCLSEEGEKVADDKDLGDKGGSDQGGLRLVDEYDETAVDHVEGSGVERRW